MTSTRATDAKSLPFQTRGLIYNLSMRLKINGDEREIPNVSSLIDLVDHLAMKSDRVAVELNREIVPRANWAATLLKDGDELEIVHFVGGG